MFQLSLSPQFCSITQAAERYFLSVVCLWSLGKTSILTPNSLGRSISWPLVRLISSVLNDVFGWTVVGPCLILP